MATPQDIHYDEKDTIAPPDDVRREEGDILNKGTVHEMTAEDRNTALQLAMQADPGIKVFSRRMLILVLMLLVVCMCGGDAGESGERSAASYTTHSPSLAYAWRETQS